MTFADFCRSLQIIIPDVILTDRWTRCGTETHPRKKNARVWIDDDGLTGFARNFEMMKKAERWTANGPHVEKTAEQQSKDNAALSRKLAARRSEERRCVIIAREDYEVATALLGVEDGQ